MSLGCWNRYSSGLTNLGERHSGLIGLYRLTRAEGVLVPDSSDSVGVILTVELTIDTPVPA